MTRRSARLQEKGKAAPPPKVGRKRKAPAKDTESQQPRKRTKKSGDGDIDTMREDIKKAPKKIPLLHRLMSEVPEDIAYEIFAYLEPPDILTLTRCSPELYTMLHSAASLHIWRNARRNVRGLPPPPPDLNEIQAVVGPIAKMFFGTAVSDLVRKNCLGELVINESELWKRYGEASKSMMIDLRWDHNLISNVKKYGSVSSDGNPKWMSNLCDGYSALEFDQLFFEYQINAGDESQLKEWVEKKRAERRRRLEHVRECETWHQEYLEEITEQKEETRAQRKEDIENNLIALGFGSEVERASEPYTHFSTHRLVRQPVELTDEEWKKIAPTFIGMMEAERERWEEELYKEHLQKRYLTLKEAYKKYIEAYNLAETGYPPLGDVIQSEILNDVVWKSPLHEPISEDDFHLVFVDKIPEFAKEWRKQKEDELQELIRERTRNKSIENLELASAVFVCKIKKCRKLLWYPTLFNHECICSRPYEPPNPPLYFDPYKTFDISPWNKSSSPSSVPSLLFYYSRGSKTIRGLIEACGSSPNTTTLKQLNDLNPVIDCKTCKWTSIKDLTWKQALAHAGTHHSQTDCIVTGSLAPSRPNKTRPFELFVRSFTTPGEKGRESEKAANSQGDKSKPDVEVNLKDTMDLD
ncbi:hypothetical protein VKT23_016745 [Stygiomarasmius scandens]|uniref:F-box domain-containing protein n=1 Tax=Marasmiellus scandens TaxID=2682957 RepID=A0ABR1ITS8_9AGAR